MPRLLSELSKPNPGLVGALCVAAVVLSLLLNAGSVVAAEILKVPVSSDIGTLDPDNGFEVSGLGAINAIYEGLVEYEPGSTRIVGLLASSWNVSGDALTYTFQLRDGVRFHDGTSMDALSVVASLDRRRSGKLVQNYTLANVQSVAAADPSTVVVRLIRPQQSFLDNLASPWGPKIISPSSINAHDKGDAATAWLTDHAVGTGPFTLAEFKRGERYVLRRHEAYWGERPYFDEIQLPVVPDIGQQILKLKAGEIDAIPTNYPFAQLSRLPSSLETTVARSMTQFGAFVKAGSPLDDPTVRAAVLTAIDPRRWAADAFGQYAHISLSLYPNALFTPVRPLAFPTDLEAAKNAIRMKKNIRLSIGLYSANPSYGRIADLLISQLASINIKATASIMPPGAAFAMKDDPRAPDLLLMIASPDAAHPESQAKAFFTAGAPLNVYGRKLPAADALIDEASGISELDKASALYEEAGRMYFEAGFAFPLVDVDDVVVHLQGLRDLGLRPVFPRGVIDFGTVRR